MVKVTGKNRAEWNISEKFIDGRFYFISPATMAGYNEKQIKQQ